MKPRDPDQQRRADPPDVVDEHVEQWQRELSDLDPLAEGIITRMQRVVSLLHKQQCAVVRQRGLLPGEYSTLHALRRRGRPYAATASELAADLLVPPQTMTGRLDGLESRGLVARERDDRDRRRVHVRMTPAGERAWREAIEEQGAAERRLVDALTVTERERLDRYLRRLLAAVEGDRA